MPLILHRRLDFPQRLVKSLSEMKALTLIVSSLGLLIGFSSCEKHDWEKTKKLYESKDDHAEHGHKDDAHKSDKH